MLYGIATIWLVSNSCYVHTFETICNNAEEVGDIKSCDEVVQSVKATKAVHKIYKGCWNALMLMYKIHLSEYVLYVNINTLSLRT